LVGSRGTTLMSAHAASVDACKIYNFFALG